MGLGWALPCSTDRGSRDTDTAGAVQTLRILMAKPGLFPGLDVALFHHGRGIWGVLGCPSPKPRSQLGPGPGTCSHLHPHGQESCKPCWSLTTILFLCLALQPPSSSTSWFWDYAVGYYLLEFLLWIRLGACGRGPVGSGRFGQGWPHPALC